MGWFGSLFLQPPESQAAEISNGKKLRKNLRLPRISGFGSALLLFLCFVLSAVVVPVSLNLPNWIEAEIVLGIWWLVWTGVLASLLYTGTFITADYGPPQPRSWSRRKDRGASDNDWWDVWLWSAPGDLGGCLIVLGLLIFLPVVLWFVVEVAIPFLAFFMYFLIRGMLSNVANDRHSCHHRLARALGWGAFWATLYTVPLMGLVWFVQWLTSDLQV